MSAAVLVLPRIWATAASTGLVPVVSAAVPVAVPALVATSTTTRLPSVLATAGATPTPAAALTLVPDPAFRGGSPVLVATRQQVEALPPRPAPVRPELAFYRKYTEALLTRYVSMSMEAGRVPSLLGREMFRGNVTSYRVHSFEDVVIFVHDVERCLSRLTEDQQYLIRRIGLQRFTQEETARALGRTPRTTMRRYAEALDRLTRIFLDVRLLEPLGACQEAGLRKIPASALLST